MSENWSIDAVMGTTLATHPPVRATPRVKKHVQFLRAGHVPMTELIGALEGYSSDSYDPPPGTCLEYRDFDMSYRIGVASNSFRTRDLDSETGEVSERERGKANERATCFTSRLDSQSPGSLHKQT